MHVGNAMLETGERQTHGDCLRIFLVQRQTVVKLWHRDVEMNRNTFILNVNR